MIERVWLNKLNGGGGIRLEGICLRRRIFLVNVSFFLGIQTPHASIFHVHFQLQLGTMKQLLWLPTGQVTTTCSFTLLRVLRLVMGGSFMRFPFIFNHCFPNPPNLFPGNGKKMSRWGPLILDQRIRLEKGQGKIQAWTKTALLLMHFLVPFHKYFIHTSYFASTHFLFLPTNETQSNRNLKRHAEPLHPLRKGKWASTSWV